MVYGLMDLSERKSWCEENGSVEIKKYCTDCKTTKTPLWRGGPAGPKSLCNACGIRYRKKRRAMLGLEKDSVKKKRTHITSLTTITTSSANTSNNTSDSNCNADELKESLKMRLIVVDGKMMFQRSSIVKKQRCQRRRKLREEEQAAFCLMALSCGSIFA
ncbi:hypothetical protein JCGZ_23252 [Jatropha curcas]|uniref:GATA-type domain-containing protein n=1 Tax=Jatropha curcas TaxID=180498 RepID=A0A067JV47_JATCU|nr:GATA transcription factor 16 [Jatropha curcas]KDP23419.1 hypothetical protein JCGZ_23252 [Jatropha curcas]